MNNTLLLSTLILTSLISSGACWGCTEEKNKIRLLNEDLSKCYLNTNSLDVQLKYCRAQIDLSTLIEGKFDELYYKLDKHPNNVNQQLSELSDRTKNSMAKLVAIEQYHQNATSNELNTIADLQAKIVHKDNEIAKLKAKDNENAENVSSLRKLLNEMKSEVKEKETQLLENETRMQKEREQTKLEMHKQMQNIRQQMEKVENQNVALKAKAENLQNQLATYSTCCKAKNCLTFGNSTNAHVIQVPGMEPVKVLCNGQIAGPGWTVFQRRINGSVNFYRNWTDYQMGFGDVDGEFFLGLERLHHITKSEPHELYIQLEDFDNQKRFARYDRFELGGAEQNYALQSLGKYSGTAGDSLQQNLNQQFSTYDRDNDSDDINCAKKLLGAWWFSRCGLSNLNGQYANMDGDYDSSSSGIFWDTFNDSDYSLKSVIMMIRPKNI